MDAPFAGVIAIGLLVACSTAKTPLCAGVPQSGTGSSSYRLGSGDQLQVVVFGQPDLSDQFSLDREGYLALPLVGELAADDLTTHELEGEIESRLKAGSFLSTPQVGVQLVTHRSFYTLGEVGTAGSDEYRNGMTVITAVALAGGYTARADRSSATIGPWRLSFRNPSRFVGQSGRYHYHCRAVLLIEAQPDPPSV
jgi:polysaccharide export outer membrane protein